MSSRHTANTILLILGHCAGALPQHTSLQALISMAGGGFGVGGLEPALQKSLLESWWVGKTLSVTVRQSVPQPNNVSSFPVRDARLFPQLNKVSS